MNLLLSNLENIKNILTNSHIKTRCISEKYGKYAICVDSKQQRKLFLLLLRLSYTFRHITRIKIYWFWVDIRLLPFLPCMQLFKKRLTLKVYRSEPFTYKTLKTQSIHEAIDIHIMPDGNTSINKHPVSVVSDSHSSIKDIFDHDFEMDAVFTWVDDQDEQWKNKYQTYKSIDGLVRSANDTARFKNRDELKYALRAMDMYTDFFRHIFIVTDGQIPKWLDTKNKKITVIDHKSIFPIPESLPTFNSHAIESCLHRIPGLSEHFVYFNDDVFISRTLSKEDFFESNGLIKAQITENTIKYNPPEMLPVDAAAMNNQMLIRRLYGRNLTKKLAHAPFALTKKHFQELENLFPAEFISTRANRFRSIDDISTASSLCFYYAYQKKEAVRCENKALYVDISSPFFFLQVLLGLRREHKFTCFNEVFYVAKNESLFAYYLKKRYSVPSMYEKAE
jgi:hypothetical protein